MLRITYHVKKNERMGLRNTVFCITLNDPGPRFPISQFYDSFNFNSELKETLNENWGLVFSPAFHFHDKYLNIRLLQEYVPASTPWHIGCKLFRRFKQISL